jgi:hypothetical protein
MYGDANEDGLKIAGADFLDAHGDNWIARQASKFSVLNVHAREIPAAAARIFPELGDQELLSPNLFYKMLFAVRAAVGKLFGWDRGMNWHGAEPLEVGKHCAFFLIEHVDAPWELAMSVENRLTGALMGWVLEESAGGTRVFNVTCANLAGRQGWLYWHVIRPFHDGLIEDSLEALERRVRQPAP